MTAPVSETRIKVCGLTRSCDVEAAVAADVWGLGFILWPESPRAVTPAQIRTLTAAVPPHIRRIGVVVNASVNDVEEYRDVAGLDAIQLHGEEDPAEFGSLGLEVIKAVSLTSPGDVERVMRMPGSVTLLVDAHDPVRRGGTGREADWTLAESVARRRPIVLAGGLRPDNVRDAVTRVHPWGVDVSSGVEVSPGVKDSAAIQAFCTSIRE